MPKKKYSLYFREIKKKIIDNDAKIIVRGDQGPLEIREMLVAKIRRNISLKVT